MRLTDAFGVTAAGAGAFVALSLGLHACGSDNEAEPDAAIMIDAAQIVDAGIVDANVPDATAIDADLRVTLESTGLYSDFDNQVIAPDVLEYAPAYPLWSDGAVKRRWVMLPAGEVIDSSNMDFWTYPVGTKLWKEFATEEGLILETRYMEKRGPLLDDWYYVSFAWNMEQNAAFEEPDGDINVLGTSFDIPSLRDCRKCHDRQPDAVLGFSALQLAHEDSGVNLASLVADSRLTDIPPGISPYYTIPGDATDQAVLGYFHSNCGGCHHPDSDVKDTTNLHLRLEVDSLATVEASSVFATTVGIAPLLGGLPGVTALIEPGAPDTSAIFVRMNLRDGAGGQQMPPRGTEVVDADAVADLTLWINRLAD